MEDWDIFIKWYKNTKMFYTATAYEEEIAFSAWLEGYKRGAESTK